MLISVYRKFKNFLENYITLIIFILPVVVLLTYIATSRQQVSSIDPAIFQTKNYKIYEEYSIKAGAQIAYEALKNHYPNNDAEAHDFAHVIGLVAYQQDGTRGLGICDTAYNYGCSHGFIEGFLIERGIDAIGAIEQSCIELGPIHAPSCLHGIGHGLMINSSYQLDTSLADCNRLKESSRLYCWDGTFMERIIGSMQGAESRLKVTAETLNEPCDSLKEIYKQQCWRNQITSWFDFFNGDTQKILSQCTKIESEFQQICFESIGLVNVKNAKENISQLIALCAITGDFLIDSCLIGELKELLFEGKNPQTAQSLCGYVSKQNSQSCQNLYEQLFTEFQIRFSQDRNLTIQPKEF